MRKEICKWSQTQQNTAFQALQFINIGPWPKMFVFIQRSTKSKHFQSISVQLFCRGGIHLHVLPFLSSENYLLLVMN